MKPDVNTRNIINLVGDDQSYLIELIGLYIEFLEGFKEEYRDVLLARDLDKLKYMAHRAKPSIQFLELNTLDQEVKLARQTLQENKADDRFVHNSIRKIHQDSDILIKILKDFAKHPYA